MFDDRYMIIYYYDDARQDVADVWSHSSEQNAVERYGRPARPEVMVIELDTPNINISKLNPAFDRVAYLRRMTAYDAEERRERAMEAGMLHGVEAYNEEMGYSLESPDDEY